MAESKPAYLQSLESILLQNGMGFSKTPEVARSIAALLRDSKSFISTIRSGDDFKILKKTGLQWSQQADSDVVNDR